MTPSPFRLTVLHRRHILRVATVSTRETLAFLQILLRVAALLLVLFAPQIRRFLGRHVPPAELMVYHPPPRVGPLHECFPQPVDCRTSAVA